MPIPEKMMLGGGEYLKFIVRAQIGDVTLIDGTHRTNTLSKGSRKGVENIHCWSEPFGESLVTSLIYFAGLPLKEGRMASGESHPFISAASGWVVRSFLVFFLYSFRAFSKFG